MTHIMTTEAEKELFAQCQNVLAQAFDEASDLNRWLTNAERKSKLFELCEEFVATQKITCAEATHEDRVYENASDFIESICEIVGYAKLDDE